MDKFVNWGEETPEQKEIRRKYEEDMRELAVHKFIMEARQAANQAAQGLGGGGGGETTTTTTTVAPTTTTTTSTTTAAPTTTTTTHVAGVDFTIEYFIKFNAFSSSDGSFHPRPYSLGAFPAKNAVSIESSGGHIYWWTGGAPGVDSLFAFSTGTWYHIAVTRNNGELSLYVDGTRLATSRNNSAIPSSGAALWIGAEPKATSPNYQSEVNGKITNFRWTAACLYTGSSFTKPSTPLTAAADTKFLMLATDSGSQLADSSTYSRTITKVGSPTWSSDSPFVSGGGSISFSGNGQYLTIPASTDWDL